MVGKISITVVKACSTPPFSWAGIRGERTMAGHRIPPSVDQAGHVTHKEKDKDRTGCRLVGRGAYLCTSWKEPWRPEPTEGLGK